MKKIFWSATLLIFGFTSNAQTTVELSPEKDNSIYSESENSNGEGRLFSGQTCTDFSRRALIEFDIAGMIPFGATITDVSLTLNMDNVSPDAGTQEYSLHRMITEWGEGTSSGGGEGDEAVAPDATWEDAMFGTSEWNDAGGDFYDVAAATLSLGEVLGDYTWTSANMVTNVQQWLDYPGSNHGWILIGDEELTCSARRFGSKDDGTAPVLEVTYTCTDGPAVARCHALTVYLDEAGLATISPEDVDAGSGAPCDGELTLTLSDSEFDCTDIMDADVVPSMIISSVFDGPLPGGLPKGVEVYVINDIEDLSDYGIGFAQNGGGTDGEEFTFPAVSAAGGTHLYVATEAAGFSEWFGFDPDYTTGLAAINGDDAIELFYEGEVIDNFGDVDVDGTGQPWEYTDGWAYRVSNTEMDGDAFDLAHWFFSGINALDGEAVNYAASTPIPVRTFSTDPTTGLYVSLIATGEFGPADSCLVSINVVDTLAPTMSCVGAMTYVLDETGVMVIDPTDLDAGTEDGCGIEALSISMDTFTCENEGENEVWLYATDLYGNSDSCMVVVTIDGSEVISILEDVLNDPSCAGFEDGSIAINIDGGTPEFLFDWDYDGTGDFDDMEDLMLIPGGTYVVNVMDENGCQAMATFELTEPEPITATVDVVNESCPGANDGTVTFDYTGGTPPYSGPDELLDQAAGTYEITVNDAEGCSMVIEYTIGVEVTIDLTVTETGADFTSNQDDAAYQWVTCPDFAVIDGATDQTYAPESPGSYAVIVTIDEGCSDTTECFAFGTDNILENSEMKFVLYPNPTKGLVNIIVDNYNSQATITVRDIKGSVVLQNSLSNMNEQIDLSNVENGIYFVQVATENALVTKKITLSK